MTEWRKKFEEITKLTHTEQAIWYLNGFWEEGAKDQAEEVWRIVHKFIEIQLERAVLYGRKEDEYDEESDIPQLKAHRLLEKLGEVHTVRELRQRLKALDVDNNNRMACIEYFVDHFNKTPQAICTAPQGTVDPVELEAAQTAIDHAVIALGQCLEDARLSAEALAASIKASQECAEAKASADAALEASQAAEAKVKAAEAELQVAIDEITSLEKEKETTIAKCQAIIDDDSVGTVTKGRAVQEKETVQREDPLPLRTAKITQEAALRKVTKARKLAETKTAEATRTSNVATQAKADSDAAQVAAEEAKKTADEAKDKAEEAEKEAHARMEELKAKGGAVPQGKLWWMDRVLTEKKKFMK